MVIHLNPEIEALVRKDVERGAYGSVDEFVVEAIQLLHAQEDWVDDDPAEIDAMIDEGLVSAEGGKFLDPDEVRTYVRQQMEQARNQKSR